MIDSNNRRHGIARKAIILALAAFLCLSLPITGVKAETPYALENLIDNGDFSIDTNSDGLADNFGPIDASTYNILANYQYLYGNATGYNIGIATNANISIVSNHKYYFKFDYMTNWLKYVIHKSLLYA